MVPSGRRDLVLVTILKPQNQIFRTEGRCFSAPVTKPEHCCGDLIV